MSRLLVTFTAALSQSSIRPSLRLRSRTAAARLVLPVVATWLAASATARGETFEIIHAFEDVRSPYAPLVQGPDGAFYGTTLEGGGFGGGAVFRVAFNGSAWHRSIIHNFDGEHGARPWSGLTVGPDGALYGTTTGGGSLSGGTVYRLVPSAGSWSHEVIHEFATNANPVAGLTLGPDGAFYGTTAAGGSADQGTVFRLSPSGSSWVHELLYSFDGSHGAEPWGRVILGADGALYGTTYRGGASGLGTIYRLENTGGVWVPTFLHSFDDADGANPFAGLTLGFDGAFYGTTEGGGSTAPNGVSAGTVFRISGSGSSWTHEVIVDFDWTNGALPSGELTNVGGVLYGTTRTISPGFGTVFRLSGGGSTWTHEIVYKFDAPFEDGAYPVAGVLEGEDAALYGTTHQGGQGGSKGTVFRLSDGGHEVLARFGGAEGRGSWTGLAVGTDGALYGTTRLGGSHGGGDGPGTVFQLARSGGLWTHEVVHDFGDAGFWGGVLLPSTLALGPDGSLYGTRQGGLLPGGAAGSGTIFRLFKSAASWVLEDLYTFNFSNGDRPEGGVVVGADGAVYGTTLAGGSFGQGTVFRLVPSSSGWTLETLHEFDGGADGGNPYSSVVFGSDGALYGTTLSGGSLSVGTAFRLFAIGASWTYEVIHEFAGPTGASPYGRLALGADGALYGTTYNGGQSGNAGTVYRLASNGTAWTHEVLAAFGDDPSAGSNPFGGLAIGNDGALYGTTAFGGSPANAGTIFRLVNDGSAWVRDVLHTCTVTDCANPRGDLLVSGHSLYGTTEAGGPEGGGVVFRMVLVPPTASVSPPSLAFGSVNLGQTSGPQAVTVTNVGGGTANVTDVTAAGDFTITDGCTSGLAEAESCTIQVSFSPTAVGLRTGRLTITTDAGGPLVVDLTGTGSTPVVTLSPASLDFAAVEIGSTGGPQAIVLQNTGTAALTINSILASGDFSATSSCPTAPATLAAGNSCTIEATFTPTAAGTRTGSLNVTDDAAGSPHSVTLTGLGTLPPAAGVAPTSLDFGGVRVGQTSAAQVVTLTNTGGGTLTLASVAATPGAFTADGSACTSGLPGGASCTIAARLTPGAAGVISGQLSIQTNAGLATVALQGIGIEPVVALSPAILDFGSVLIGATSASQAVTLQNTGTAPLAISAITAAGDFAQTTTCPIAPASLVAGGSCSIAVSFTPTAAGTRSEAVTVTNDAAGSPHTVPLIGTGVVPAAYWDYTILKAFPTTGPDGSNPFGLLQGRDGVLYGVTSAAGTGQGTVFKVNPDGTGFATIWTFDGANGANPSAELVQGPDGTLYGTTYAGGASNVGTVFRVNTEGTGFATLATFDGANGRYPDAALVQGADGTLYGTTSTAGPAGFGTVFTVNPDGTGFATVLSFNISNGANPYGELVQGTDGALYGTTLFGGGGGTVFKVNPDGTGFATLVNFAGANGSRPFSGLIQLADGTLYGTTREGGTANLGTVFRVNPDGTGFATLLSFGPNGAHPKDGLLLAADGALYGTTEQGGASNAGTIYRLNPDGTGYQTLFALAGTNGTTPVPELVQGRDGALYGAAVGGGPLGGGVAFRLRRPGSPLVQVTPTAVDFGNQNVQTSSNVEAVTVTNAGGEVMHVTGTTTTGDFQATTTDCTSDLGTSDSCSIQVAFNPTGVGLRTGLLTIATDAGTPWTVPLSGTGTLPVAGLAPGNVRFGVVTVGLSDTRAVTLSNTGDGPMTITSIAASGDYSATSDCPATPTPLAPGASCSVTVTFAPTVTGARMGTLTVLSDATNNPRTAHLNGTGTLPLVATPATLSFADQAIGTTSAPQALTLSNPSPVLPIPLGSIAMSGDYLQTNSCGTSIPVGASCTVTVRFAPSKKGNLKGTLIVTSGATTSPNEIKLSGKGF